MMSCFVLQVYKQKVKHLLYEHQNNISTLKADGELGPKLAGEEAAKREGELQKDCRTLKLELKEQVGVLAVMFLLLFSFSVRVLCNDGLSLAAQLQASLSCFKSTEQAGFLYSYA